MRQLNVAYPAAGLLTSVADLLKYSAALDEGVLLDEKTYANMTHPMMSSSDEAMPYAFGWFAQKAHGVTMHWAYGLGGADSALLLRVPERKLTLVVMSNCSFASEPFRLGSGNALNSPFVVSFIKHFVLPENDPKLAFDYDRPLELRDTPSQSTPIYHDELCAQAFCRTFIERKFGEQLHGYDLVKLLVEVDRERFSQADPSLMHLLSWYSEKTMDSAAKYLLHACREKYLFHPEVEFAAARRLERQGRIHDALTAYRKVADHSGFMEQESTIKACSDAARLLLQSGEKDLALEYQWRSIIHAYRAGYDTRTKLGQFHEMSRSPRRKTIP